MKPVDDLLATLRTRCAVAGHIMSQDLLVNACYAAEGRAGENTVVAVQQGLCRIFVFKLIFSLQTFRNLIRFKSFQMKLKSFLEFSDYIIQLFSSCHASGYFV